MSRVFLNLYIVIFLLIGCVPEDLQRLWDADLEVANYKSFEQITALYPVAAKFKIVKTLLGLAKGETTFFYDLIKDKKNNDREKWINSYFDNSQSLQNSLRLISYARQLKANHPYRINYFVPYFTSRLNNLLFDVMRVGPAALGVENLQRTNCLNCLDKTITLKNDNGEDFSFKLKSVPAQLPETGAMLLFDHALFTIADLAGTADESGILEDVIIHEFTHLWHGEVLSEKARNENNVMLNASENGHDVMVVTNPNMAFSEGLAEAFEAIFGSVSNRTMNMNEQERKGFFARMNHNLVGTLTFLVNRQRYIRENSYLYNLHDFGKCSLRSNDDKSDLLTQLLKEGMSLSDALNRVIDQQGASSARKSLQAYEDRFYGESAIVDPLDLKKDCQLDSPNRLISKEGFVATLIYSLLTSGALVDQQIYGEKSDYQGRKGLEAGFLIGFRAMVEAIIQSDAITFKDFAQYLLSEKSTLPQKNKLSVAYIIVRNSQGLFTDDPELIELTRDGITDVKAVKERIQQLSEQGQLMKVISKLSQYAPIYVEYLPLFTDNSGTARRIDINNAYYLDLIDIFGPGEEIDQLAQRLDQGMGFNSQQEFLDFAQSIGQKFKASQMLAAANKSMQENENLSKGAKKLVPADIVAPSSILVNL